MTSYWENRYASGGSSGRGSRGRFAQLKSALVNGQLRQYDIQAVLDIGSGDGQVAQLIDVDDYLGVDPSPTARKLAQTRNPNKEFRSPGDAERRDAHLSLDILHHLVDDDAYRGHMQLLFSAHRLVLIWVHDYTTNRAASWSRHRRWQYDVPKDWQLADQVAIEGEPVTFYAYTKVRH